MSIYGKLRPAYYLFFSGQPHRDCHRHPRYHPVRWGQWSESTTHAIVRVVLSFLSPSTALFSSLPHARTRLLAPPLTHPPPAPLVLASPFVLPSPSPGSPGSAVTVVLVLPLPFCHPHLLLPSCCGHRSLRHLSLLPPRNDDNAMLTAE